MGVSVCVCVCVTVNPPEHVELLVSEGSVSHSSFTRTAAMNHSANRESFCIQRQCLYFIIEIIKRLYINQCCSN